MTDPVEGVRGARDFIRGNFRGGNFSEHRKKRVTTTQQSDLIEISKNARDRSPCKPKKRILEYLKELF
jgi:hypothetical protein